MLGCDERGIGQGKKAAALQRNTSRKGGECVVDDVVVLQVLLQFLDIVNLHHHAQPAADQHDEGVDQGLGRLAADVGFLALAELLHLFICEALDLLMGELLADDLLGLSGRDKDRQLLALGGNVFTGRYEIRQPRGQRGAGCGFQQLHHILHGGFLVCFHRRRGIHICVSSFNDLLNIRQQGLELPDDPRHGVGHGLQPQGVSV